jgi:hypothetical protein
MYTIFSAVQRQQRKSDVMTSFGLTACSAIYYQVPHCRFLIDLLIPLFWDTQLIEQGQTLGWSFLNAIDLKVSSLLNKRKLKPI